MNKYLMIPIIIVLVISGAMNIFLIRHDNKTIENVPVDNTQKEYVQLLENELKTVRESLQTVTKNIDSSSNIQTLQSMTDLEKTSISFLEHLYNVNTENYGTVKQSARNIMSVELFHILFSAHGLDTNVLQTTTTLEDVEVFQHSKKSQVFVKFKLNVLDNSSGTKIEETHMMILHFKQKNNTQIVEMIEPISEMGAV